MNGGPAGFHNAPVSRAVVAGAAVFTVALGRSIALGISYEGIFQKLNIWRLIASLFAFSSTPELVFGGFLLYYFRVFERQIGSNKYAAFILFSMLNSLVFEVVALGFLKDPSLNPLASGPYGLIFASFVPFYFDIPVSSRLRILGLRLSNKSLIYLAGLQLLFSSGRRSVIPGMCGIISGLFYHLNTLGIRRLKLPDVTASLFHISWPFSSSISQASSMGNDANASLEGRQLDLEQATLNDPYEESIATLLSIGFDRDSARQALVLTGNDVNLASNILFEAQR